MMTGLYYVHFQKVVFCETAHKGLGELSQAPTFVHNPFPKNTQVHLRWFSSR